MPLQLPNTNVPVVGPDGRMTKEWYQFFSAVIAKLNTL
jgi:hypothetical protein